MEDRPFKTPSCTDCSNFRWGTPDRTKFIVDNNGESRGCLGINGKVEELEINYTETQLLTPEDALDYYGPNGKFCKRYNGPIPHTLEEIQQYISKHSPKK